MQELKRNPWGADARLGHRGFSFKIKRYILIVHDVSYGLGLRIHDEFL